MIYRSVSNLKGTTFFNILIQPLKIFFISNYSSNLYLNTLLNNRLLSSTTPRVFTGNKKASPFWLEDGLAKDPLSIVWLISDTLDSKDGRFTVMSL